MALLEGYEALKDVSPKAGDYLNAGLDSAEMTIRWLEDHGLNSDGSDYYGNPDGSDYNKLKNYIQLRTGTNPRDPPEKTHGGGDKAMSTLRQRTRRAQQ